MYRIKVMRVMRRMNQTELAKQLGISKATLSYWETGRVSPRVSDLQRCAEILGCKLSDLFDEEDTDERVS